MYARMRKLASVLFVLSLSAALSAQEGGKSFTSVLAQKNILNHMDVGVNVGTMGIGVDVAVLMKYTAKNFHFDSLPKFPATARDLAIVVDKDAEAGAIEQVIAKNGGKFFKGVTLFDVYTGEHVEEGKKSLAFNLQFQSKDKTLTDEEADAAFSNILKAVEKHFDAKLRA